MKKRKVSQEKSESLRGGKGKDSIKMADNVKTGGVLAEWRRLQQKRLKTLDLPNKKG